MTVKGRDLGMKTEEEKEEGEVLVSPNDESLLTI